jgi:succinate dehydrogenase / fumarate reductase cytochrome b subunit
MGWLSATFNSSIGRKTVMAGTGLLQVLFLLGHLAGNANTFRGRTAYEAHAARLHNLGGLLHLLEIFLLLAFLLHLGMGLYLFLDNLKARPTRYFVSKSAGGRTWGSRTMPYTGLFLLVFLFLHLSSFRFTEYTSISELVRDSLSRPGTGAFYLAAILALTLHLGHGLWSIWQSLGLSHPKYEVFLERAALALSIFTGTLYSMIPILALFWPGFLR